MIHVFWRAHIAVDDTVSLRAERLCLGRALFTSAASGQRSKDLELQA